MSDKAIYSQLPFYKTKPKRRDGFTLVELLLILTIVSILIGVSVAVWNKVTLQQEQNRFVFGLRWLMMEARQKAITENLPVRIAIEWKDRANYYAKSISWLQLPCNFEEGPLSRKTCPTEACVGTLMDTDLTRCTPVSKSEKLNAPAGIRMHGFVPTVCFLGGSGLLSQDCQTQSSKQGAGIESYFPLYIDNRDIGYSPRYYYYIHQFTSYIELINCNNPEDANNSICY
ncbi:MAG: prepilin-type N-terminal cleavage/methylation domain-containing protein [Cystobacterineae bacterium]|nr:prepilin-type N-terminal cleavage/methylation domain-containing protein [Cystobacterineae bacterium]